MDEVEGTRPQLTPFFLGWDLHQRVLTCRQTIIRLYFSRAPRRTGPCQAARQLNVPAVTARGDRGVLTTPCPLPGFSRLLLCPLKGFGAVLGITTGGRQLGEQKDAVAFPWGLLN